ncbi:Ubiquitin-activating enzyme E1 1 [Hibiscus syriacus]|uniref:E1 ubiquitin-activating enzyme n=1 Tax=Hibiscus syriacus TaxID=106335 RepID=A0A6A3CIV3_HIBSY|nr:Ubiquitin-activating enzyme E1 1 [Hibiscus syriacus]
MLPRKRTASDEIMVIEVDPESSGNTNHKGASASSFKKHRLDSCTFAAVDNGSTARNGGNSVILAVYGRETMRRLFASNILISGMQGLGAEIAKNLILAGVKSVTLHDEGAVELWDLSSNFAFTESDVVSRKPLSSTITVILISLPFLSSRLKLEVFFGSIFCDFGPGFTVVDVDGEDPHTGIIASISNDNLALVSCVDDERLEFQDGDLVVFSEVHGMTELNDGKPRKIKSAKPYSFTLEEDTTNFGRYIKGGIVTQVKQPKLLNFKPLRDGIKDPGDYLLSDFSKFDRPPLLHLAFQALDKFVSGLGRFPLAGSEEDANKLISIAGNINESLGDGRLEDINPKLLRFFSFGSRAVLNPMAAMFGGIVGQEVVKACSGKFHPLFQKRKRSYQINNLIESSGTKGAILNNRMEYLEFFYFDSVESLPTEPMDPSDFRPLNSRYEAQISVFGSKLQKKMEEAKVFIVGSGALGCEFLKNIALMGVSCGSQGKLTMTDDDVFEKSNLSRQFFFRDWNIGQAKSTVAASAVASINPCLNIEALQNRVGPETENVFDDTFWENLTVVINALDDLSKEIIQKDNMRESVRKEEREKRIGQSSSGGSWIVFVDNLSKRVTRSELRNIFIDQGQVFGNETEMRNAVENINGLWIDGRKIYVGVAKYQSVRPRVAGSSRLSVGVQKSSQKTESEHIGKSYESLDRGRWMKKKKNIWEMHIPTENSSWVKRSLTGIVKHSFELELVQKEELMKDAWSNKSKELWFWFDRLAPLLNEGGVPMAYCLVELFGVPLLCWQENFLQKLAGRWGSVEVIQDSTLTREDLSMVRILLRVESPFDVPEVFTLGSYEDHIRVTVVESSEEEDDSIRSSDMAGPGQLDVEDRQRVNLWIDQRFPVGVGAAGEENQFSKRSLAGKDINEVVSEDRSSEPFSPILRLVPAGPAVKFIGPGNANQKQIHNVSSSSGDGDKDRGSQGLWSEAGFKDTTGMDGEVGSAEGLKLSCFRAGSPTRSASPISWKSAPVGRKLIKKAAGLAEGVCVDQRGKRSYRRMKRSLTRDALDHASVTTVSTLTFSGLLEEAIATWEISRMLGISFKEGKNAFLQKIMDLEKVCLYVGGDFNAYLTEEKDGRLDRFLVNVSFLSMFSDITQSLLTKSISDHNAIILESGEDNWGKRPFRLISYLMTEDGFQEKVAESINEFKRVRKKAGILSILRNTKFAIKTWSGNRNQFPSKQISAIEDKIHHLENSFQKNQVSGVIDSSSELKLLRDELWRLYRIEEQIWFQNSREKWVKDGDRNSKFFHTCASIRRRRNALNAICVDGVIIRDLVRLKSAVKEHFFKAFNSRTTLEVEDIKLNFSRISMEQSLMLEKEFTEGKILETLNSCDSNKVPGPGGLNDFRPISLVGGMYKILSKCLSRRLRCCMDDVKGLKGCVLKVDFKKAYDTVDWDILFKVMVRMGFGLKWCGWIRKCVSTASVSVLVNGVPTDEFPMARGLRQGCSLSPLLFNFIGELLNLLIRKAVSSGLFSGLIVGKDDTALNLSHLQISLSSVWLRRQILNVKRVLRVFEVISGLQLNLTKCRLFGINISEEEVLQWANTIGCVVGHFPSEYLGLPLGAKRNSIALWDPIVQKFNKKLASWKARTLSVAGRLVLLKVVLCSLPTYFMSLFKIPSSVIVKLNSIMASFLWGGGAEVKKIHWINWSTVCSAKSAGGLGVLDLNYMNRALLGKWSWRFANDRGSVWKKVICSKYNLDPSLLIFKEKLPAFSSWIWKLIVNNHFKDDQFGAKFRSLLDVRVGSGDRISFWSDNWATVSPLKEVFPRLFVLSVNKNGKLKEFGEFKSSVWCWHVQLRRSLSDWELVQFCDLMTLIHNIPLSKDLSDGWVWRGNGDGIYSVKTSVQACSPVLSVDSFWMKFIWRGLVPPRVEVFLWQVVHHRLPVKQELQRRGVSAVIDVSCPLCKKEANAQSFLIAWEHLVPNSRIWSYIPGVVLWTIWKYRNDIVFDGGTLDQIDLFFMARCRLAIWFITNTKDVSILKDSSLILLLGIIALSQAVNGDWRKSGVGGILRDEDGSVMGSFQEPSGPGPPTLIELLAVKRGLIFFEPFHQQMKERLLIESDNKLAVEWVKNFDLCPGVYSNLVKDIVTKLRELNGIIRWVARLYVDQRCLYFQKPLLESGTLGAKCNTQMVIRHLTENYGASRDPPEKQAPMCTVHSFPHNIDHCLTWARSEFEGLLEKTPAEVNVYLSNPDEYKAAQRNAGDAQARDNLERILECLETEKCVTFQDCITWARLRFEDYFVNRMKQLIYTFPEDAATSTGAPFWSAPKRFPHPLHFSAADPSHLQFIMAASILRAETFGIPVPDWVKQPKILAEAVDKVTVPEFQPKKDAKIVTDDKATTLSTASIDDAAVINELIFKLELCSKKIAPRDDDTNYHMDLIVGLANMRARNYNIPEVDKLKAKFIAGRIIPAIATSTAVATGLVCLELYKALDGGHKLEDYRNTFANLALPLFSMAEPVPPKVIKHGDMSWTVWDRWILRDNPTLRELIQWLKDKGLNAYSISYGSCLLYNSMFPRHRERMDKKIVDLAREVTKAELPPNKKHLDVIVACEDDDDNDIDIPQFSIYFS